MKYVLDASVAVRWVIQTPLTPKAFQLRADYQQHLHELIAPAHFPNEVASSLTKSERQKVIPVGDAHKLIADVLTTPPQLHLIDDPLFYRAVDLSSRTRSAFYDCLYVALAERENCELITVDDRLIKNLQGQFPFVVSLAALP